MPNKKKTIRIFWTILGLTFICLMINFPKQIPVNINLGKIKWQHTFYRPNFNFFKKESTNNLDLKFGLDLAGGSSITFDIDISNVKKENLSSALESLKSNIERRVNPFGNNEANIQINNQQNNYRLNVELPGIENSSEAIELVGRTAQLSFKGVIDEELFKEATTSAEIEKLMKDTGLNGSHLIPGKAIITLNPNTSEPEVSIEFNKEGSKIFEKATTDFLNKQIVIFLDDQFIMAPNVKVVIPDGKAVISGGFTNESAKRLAIQLNAGSLPLPVNLIQQTQIGSTLGKDSINKGIFAGIVGLILISLFMIGNYGKLGLIADIGLIIYGLIILALYRLIPVTLTFPGIVGFILSFGMAVDSNILIFERMKEELHKGKSWNNAMELAFGRAWSSIKDGGTCTILIGLILFNPLNWSSLNTSGMVRGFAVTLLLGITVGIFTGVFITRNLLRVLAKGKKQK
jgi:preprotein translocase subunit SecD